MYLQVSPAGSKRWFLKYRIAGTEKQLALGSYPDVTLTNARKARDAAKLQKATGADPVQARSVDMNTSAGTFDSITLDRIGQAINVSDASNGTVCSNNRVRNGAMVTNAVLAGCP
jgi:hypothetical protein